MSSAIALISLIRLRARNLLHLALPQWGWLASSSATGQLLASCGQSRITSAADSCPAPIRRLSCARARLISFARASASSGCPAIVAVRPGAPQVVGDLVEHLLRDSADRKRCRRLYGRALQRTVSTG